MKPITIHVLFGLITVAYGQQYFQKTGDNHETKVAITRYKEVPRSAPLGSKKNGKGLNPKKSWRQGDRVTKEDIIQNLSRALLAHKRNPDELQAERKRANHQKLLEYSLYEARMAKKAAKNKKRGPVRTVKKQLSEAKLQATNNGYQAPQQQHGQAGPPRSAYNKPNRISSLDSNRIDRRRR